MAVSLGCSPSSPPATSTSSSEKPELINARLVVSSDFGMNVLADKEVSLQQGVTCLEVLSNEVDINTAYGGAFVTSIEGIKSGYLKQPVERTDWFLYINGMLSNTGGLAYRVNDGDIIHWYYRDWSFRQSVSAIIGDFPGSLKYGYGGKNVPVTVWHDAGWQNEARDLQQFLLGVGIEEVYVRGPNEITPSEQQEHHLVIIGSNKFEPMIEINHNWDRLGMFCRFNNNVLEI